MNCSLTFVMDSCSPFIACNKFEALLGTIIGEEPNGVREALSGTGAASRLFGVTVLVLLGLLGSLLLVGNWSSKKNSSDSSES